MGSHMKLCFRKHLSELTQESSILVKIAWGNTMRAIHAIYQNENLVSEVRKKIFLEV